VYLIAATGYNPVTSGGNKTAGQKNECHSIQVISDTELVCTLDLAKLSSATINTALTVANTPTGLYQVTVVGDGTVGANAAPRAAQALSSGADFAVAPF
jgi:hypothetical protein